MSDTISTEPAVHPEAEPAYSKPDSFAVRGFQKGYDPRRNLAGRIKKQPTVLDEAVQLAHKAKNRRKIARAWVDTMAETGTAAGNRARADFSDRIYGLPKQTLILEQGSDPLTALFSELAEHKQLPSGEQDITQDTQ